MKPTWIYKVELQVCENSLIEESYLCKQGREGWELCGIENGTLFRPRKYFFRNNRNVKSVKWEYMFMFGKPTCDAQEEQRLDQQGAKGWELVEVSKHWLTSRKKYIFKRELE